LNPYPPECRGKIPYFKRSGQAALKVTHLREFRKAQVVKVNPSLAQMSLRRRVMEAGKTLIVPAPSLSPNDPNGGGKFMFKLEGLTDNATATKAMTKKGAKRYGTPLRLDNWDGLRIEFFVVGAVAVTSRGVRLGKGLGYAEMEWAILTKLGVVDENTVVVATVDDVQIVEDSMLPVDQVMDDHDLPVDIIVTPTKIIRVRPRLTKPTGGILWDKLSPERIQEMPILCEFRRMNL